MHKNHFSDPRLKIGNLVKDFSDMLKNDFKSAANRLFQ